MTLDVYGVGNTLVDIQVQVTDELLESLGFAKGMMTLVDHETQQRVLSALGELPRNQCAGGSAANTILGVAGLGGSTAYAGKSATTRWGTSAFRTCEPTRSPSTSRFPTDPPGPAWC